MALRLEPRTSRQEQDVLTEARQSWFRLPMHEGKRIRT